MKKLFIFLALMTLSHTSIADVNNYDMVISNGRIMDPETNFDAVANVGIKNGRIAIITDENIKGNETIADKGTYTEPNQPAVGIQTVMADGFAVVANGKLTEDAAPGKPIRRAVATNVETVKCPEVRPEMCTMDYNPVCGNLSDGSFKTYSNGCNACTDPKVISYSQGECREADKSLKAK